MEIFSDMIVSQSEAFYGIINDEFVKSGGAQASYNVSMEFFNYAINNDILVLGDSLEHLKQNKGSKYILVEEKYVLKDYKFKLGPAVLWLIGEKYANENNELIISRRSRKNEKKRKPQIYKTDYDKSEWFQRLYAKNLTGNQVVLTVDDEKKILTFDIKFNAITGKIDYENTIDDDKDIEELDSDKVEDVNWDYPFNRIFFGAPGTGKSFTLNNQRKELLGETYKDNYERVTFHPDYSYAHFVGTYKPVPKDSEGKIISYEYVPGPFMRILVEALEHPSKPYLLIIEEINRANVATVFGDIFQLLDRESSGLSEYPIQTSEDMRNYLHKKLGGNIDDYKTIKLPSNLFLWATMNSADQGVYMMDTAFKRRWNFSYIGINNSDDKINDINVHIGKDIINWNELRKAINNELLSYNINEDKLIGPFFIPLEYLNDIDFIDIFKNKVIMYLFEDVAKQRRQSLFNKDIKEGEYLLYSEICEKIGTEGIGIFCQNIINNVNPINSGD